MCQLFHGGDVYTASKLFGRAADDWLDLSTGINPSSYPAPPIASKVWQQLPYVQPALMQAATNYYGQHPCLASSGSQPIIELLPQVLCDLGNTKAAWIADVGYQEHRYGWSQYCPVQTYDGLCSQQASQQIDAAINQGEVGHLVVINPNNPTGALFSAPQLRLWAEQLAVSSGFLVVDEAFIDTQPVASLLNQTLPDNLVVLRSVGKFFGLAGMRLGFTFASKPILSALQQYIGPWSVNGPAQSVAITALNDKIWQQQIRQKLVSQASTQLELWHKTMLQQGATLAAQHELFRCFSMVPDIAHHLHQSAAEQGILLRLVDVNAGKSLLRFGNIDLSQGSALKRCKTWLLSLRTIR